MCVNVSTNDVTVCDISFDYESVASESGPKRVVFFVLLTTFFGKTRKL